MNCLIPIQFTTDCMTLWSLQIVYEGLKRYRDSYGIEQTMIDPTKDLIVPKEETSLYIDGLVPMTVYTFNISAKYIERSWGPAYTLQVETSIDG